MKKIVLRLFVIFVIVLALSLMGGVSWSVYFLMAGMDVPEPDVTDLSPERVEISSEKNGYTYFSRAFSLMPEKQLGDFPLVRDDLSGKAVNQDKLHELLTRNGRALALFEDGIACGVCVTPVLMSFKDDSRWVGSCFYLIQLEAVKSRMARDAGDLKGATSQCIRVLQCGEILLVHPQSMVQYLVGISTIGLGLKEVDALVRDSRIQTDDLDGIAKELAKIDSLDQSFVRGVKADGFTLIQTIRDFYRDPAAVAQVNEEPLNQVPVKVSRRWRLRYPSYIFQPNRTIKIVADINRNFIRHASSTYAELKAAGVLQQPERNSENGLRVVFTPNVIGVIFSELGKPDAHLLELKCIAQLNFTGAKTLLALNLYQRKEGKLPETLDALVPAYLAAVPVDPLDGKPFRYRPEKGIIYSVGKDLKDSGGSTRPLVSGKLTSKNPILARWEAEDAVFELYPVPGK